MADSKDLSIGQNDATHRQPHGEKHTDLFTGKKDVDSQDSPPPPPMYNEDAERHGSVAITGIRDNTHRKLKPRHIQLIGIGGTIGTALYVQIGRGLLQGGPGSLFLAFTIW